MWSSITNFFDRFVGKTYLQLIEDQTQEVLEAIKRLDKSYKGHLQAARKYREGLHAVRQASAHLACDTTFDTGMGLSRLSSWPALDSQLLPHEPSSATDVDVRLQ